MAILGALAGVLVIPAGLLAGRALSRTERGTRTVGIACVLLIAAWFGVEEYSTVGLRLLPWDDFACVQRVPLHLLIFTLLGVCLPRLSSGVRQLTIVVAVIFALYVVAESAAPAALGLYLDALDGSVDGPAEVTQSTGWSCGAAALAWMLRLDGVRASEREMARLAVIAPLRGMSRRGAVRALHRKGLTTRVVRGLSWEELVAAPKPALAGWKLSGTIGHAIVVISTDADRVTVGDPLIGETTHGRDEFLRRWDHELVLVE